MATLFRGLGDAAVDAESLCLTPEGGRRAAASAHRERDRQSPRLHRGGARQPRVGPSLSGADIQMSFVAEVAKSFGKLTAYPNFTAWLPRIHARPGFQRSVEKGGAYRLAG